MQKTTGAKTTRRLLEVLTWTEFELGGNQLAASQAEES